jgi:hypothetical protein
MRIIVILLIGGKPHPKFRTRRGEYREYTERTETKRGEVLEQRQ